MLYGIILFTVIFTYVHPMADKLAEKYKVDGSVIKSLFYYHYLLFLAYYLYAQFNPSDSINYYQVVSRDAGNGWLYFYGTSTTFIWFLAYPLVNFFGFTYEAVMVFFAFIGFLGIVYLYIFFKENIKLNHTLWSYHLITILFFLPNTHFWTVSLGKGSIIFLGIGLFFFSISKPGVRIIQLIVGILIIYHVRAHILFVMVVSAFVGFVASSGKVPLWQKTILIILAFFVFINIYEEVLISTGLDIDFFEESGALSTRAYELSRRATSGVDVYNYSLAMQLFTFWFRPLFFDAPGALGYIVSIENIVYLIIILKLFGLRFPGFLIRSDPLVKTSILTFLLTSYPLAQISGNLGLSLRQKSMVMLLLFFSLLVFQDKIKLKKYKERLMMLRRRKIQEDKKIKQ